MKFKVMALAALVSLGTVSVQANELPNGPHIVTSGTASVDAVPDVATLAIEVNVAAKDAASQETADDRVAQYLSFLEQNGCEKRHELLNLRTQPDYDYQNGKSILKGYRAVRTVEVTVRQLDKLNGLLDGALKAGLTKFVPSRWALRNRRNIKTKRVKRRLMMPFIRRSSWHPASRPSSVRFTACATTFQTTSQARWFG